MDKKYEQALDAICEMYSDSVVSKETALERLRGLLDEIGIMIDALENTDET